MRTETITLYRFNELSDEAKQYAIEQYRANDPLDYDWWHFVYDDFLTIADLIGLDIDKRKGCRGHAIYFSGFWSQGDGASFEGNWSYRKGMLAAVKSHAPCDEELHSIVAEMQQLQRRHFYKLEARINHHGNYHSMSVTSYVDGREASYETDCEVKDVMYDLARWLYRQLENEYEYLMSDEHISEILFDNEYEFLEDGTRA